MRPASSWIAVCKSPACKVLAKAASGQRERRKRARRSAAVIVLPLGDGLIGRAGESVSLKQLGCYLFQRDAGYKECASIPRAAVL